MNWEQIEQPAYHPYVLLGWCRDCGEPIYSHAVVTGDWRGQTMHRDPRQQHVSHISGSLERSCFNAPHNIGPRWPEPNGDSICIGEAR